MAATTAPLAPPPLPIERPDQLSERLEQVAGRLLALSKDGVGQRFAAPLRDCVLDLRGVWSALRQFALVFDANRVEKMLERERELRQAMDIVNGTVASLSAAGERTATDVGRQLYELDALDAVGDPSLLTQKLRSVSGSVRQAASGMREDVCRSAARLGESEQIIRAVDRKLAEARAQALRDGLTRVLSRVAFEQRVRELAAQSGAVVGAWCVALADIDHFAAFNEKHGRLVGDALLFRVAALIQGTCETYPGAIVGRYGGEEFGILLPRSPLREGRQMAEEIRGSISLSKWECKGGQAPTVISATVSLGVVERRSGEATEALLRRAESCLQQAKRRGRNTVVAEG